MGEEEEEEEFNRCKDVETPVGTQWSPSPLVAYDIAKNDLERHALTLSGDLGADWKGVDFERRKTDQATTSTCATCTGMDRL